MSDISSDSSFQLMSDSDHSDDDILSEEARKRIHEEGLSEERMKLLEQRLTNAVSKGFWLGLLSACFLCFLVIGACALLSGLQSVQHNAKLTVTVKNPGKVYNFPKEKTQKILDDVRISKEDTDKFKKISEMHQIVQGTTDIRQLPDNLRNKYIPDFSRFEGVDEFLQITQTKETIVEDYLYYSSPRFEILGELLRLRYVNMDTLESVEDFRIGDCETFTDCHYFSFFMKNGDLYIHEKIVLNAKEYEFKRVYFIPPHKMI